MLALYVITGFVLIVSILLLIKVNVHFTFAFENKVEGLEVELQYLFLKKVFIPSHKKEKNEHSIKQDNTKKDSKFSIELMYYLARRLKRDIFKALNFIVLKTAKVERFTFESRIGTDDPMLTGIATGAVNGFVYNSLALLDRHGLLKSFRVDICPDWNNKVFKGSLYVKIYTNIFTVLRLAFIILFIALKALRLIKKFRKENSYE